MNVVKAAAWTVMVGALGAATSAAEQAPARPAAATAAQIQARQQISAFEAALENAVRSGAQMLDQRLQASTAANMVMLAGLARARGFRLDDYGVVFDVEFPSMRRSMVWSMQELERAQRRQGTAGERHDLFGAAARDLSDRNHRGADRRHPRFSGADWRRRDRMADGRGPRKRVDRRFVPGDPGDTAITVILRMKGSDLSALRNRTLPREEARKRIEVKQY